MKIPCNLCEKSFHKSKIDGMGCSHPPLPFIINGNIPEELDIVRLGLQSGLPNNQFLQLPQLNVKLASYLLRGEELTDILRKTATKTLIYSFNSLPRSPF